METNKLQAPQDNTELLSIEYLGIVTLPRAAELPEYRDLVEGSLSPVLLFSTILQTGILLPERGFMIRQG